MSFSKCFVVSIVLISWNSVLCPGTWGQRVVDESRVGLVCAEVAKALSLSSIDGKRRFKLADGSKLRWSKNTYEDVYGNVFVWTDRGAPVAVASVFQFTRPKDDVDFEIHSLSPVPIRATVGERVVWQPRTAGVNFVPIDSAPQASPTNHAVQIRLLARRFRAERQDVEGNTGQLRLLPTPIFKYVSQPNGILGGAIFAFVDQTDPEALLMIEAKVIDDGQPIWQYAIARLNNRRIRGYDNGRIVYEADHYDTSDRFGQSYTFFQRLQDDPAFGLDQVLSKQ